MEVYPLSHTGEDDQPIAFEIDNVYIRPGTIASLLKAIEGITDVRKRVSVESRERFMCGSNIKATTMWHGSRMETIADIG